MNKLPQKWLEKLDILDIAFQPILNVHTGKIHAVEALLRNFEDAGFQSIFEVFDKVYEENLLFVFDLALREKTFKKYTQIDGYQDIKLFYNIDNRIYEMPDFTNGETNRILKKLGIPRRNICFEISERHEISKSCSIEQVIAHYREEDITIAIDDFGIGYSGYKLLYDSTPDIIKIDRFFLQDINKNPKKQLMVRSITNLAIQLGIQILAEGVETKEELLTCKEIGCHLLQGFLAQKPTRNCEKIVKEYQHIIDIIAQSKREKNHATAIEKYTKKLEPLYKKQQMSEVVDYFKKHEQNRIAPVLNAHNEPVGIFYENQIREYLYSPFGISLLHNDTSSKSKLKNLIVPCASIDINNSIETIITLFSNNEQSAGIIITMHAKYYGFLSARAIINIMNEENLVIARDQNPLTKLPGNRLIQKYISNIPSGTDSYMLCYFDLDNFKAFNDIYGFRNGDRVIQLFADILRNHIPSEFFKAHIGGDDFFIANRVQDDNNMCLSYINDAIRIFASSAKKFYSQEDQKRGYIIAKDREGSVKKFPLLSVSASIILTNKDQNNNNFKNNINDILALQKKVAKNEPSHLAISCFI